MKQISSKETIRSNKSLLIEEKEILSDLSGTKGSSLFLGRYSFTEVEAVLRKKNFFKDARKRKLWPVVFDLDSSEFPPLQRLRIFYKKKAPENIVVDLKIKEGAFRAKESQISFLPRNDFKFLHLEWLTLQNPLLQFEDKWSALPGQAHPGLSLGNKVLDIFIYLARLTKCEGLLAFPAYFHNALLFSRQFRFLNPQKEGEVLAIRKSFKGVPFKELAWIIHLDCLRQENGGIYEWRAEEQVYPLVKPLKKYFERKDYRKKVKEAEKNLRFSIDWESYSQKRGQP